METKKLFDNFPSETSLLEIIKHTSSIVWKSELIEKDIENWLSNFKGEVIEKKYERLLALWLLSHFTYYNKEEVMELCRVLYRDLLHLILIGVNNENVDYETTINSFFENSNILSPEKTSGSGGFIAYFFRQENNLPMTLFNFNLDNVSPKIENIIFIDDVTLTSGKRGQMYSFLKKAKKQFPTKKFYLLTLISSEASYNFLKEEFQLEIVTAIKLDNRDKCFHIESDVFCTFKKLNEICKNFAIHYGKKINIPDVEPLGFGNGQYTFGFFYNTPDNTLPIFWGQINGWKPILRRYHKNYAIKIYSHYERFI